MSTITIVDLEDSVELDSQALAAITGGYHVVQTGPWNHYATAEQKTSTVINIGGLRLRKWKRTKYAKRTQRGRKISHFYRRA